MSRALDFFKRLENTVAGSTRLPRWVGELYLEYHRGTYTSMAKNKKYNRKSEFLYQDAEWLSVMNMSIASGKYPARELGKGWRTILLNQFHDILPGTAIKEVYEDSETDYREIIENGNKIKEKAMAGIAGKINLKHSSIIVFNQLCGSRSDIVEAVLPDGYGEVWVYDDKGNNVQIQPAGGRKIIFLAGNIPSKGYRAFSMRKAEDSFAVRAADGLPGTWESMLQVSTEGMRNRFFDIKLDADANIVSIYDMVNCREVLKPGCRGNALQAFDDRPPGWDLWNMDSDAWELNISYQDKMWEINDATGVETVESGPVRAVLKVTRKFRKSTIEQYMYIYSDIPRIDFKTVIDWKECHTLLKAAFPVDIHADNATYDIQFGNIERPTYWNTSWDRAKFEVCAHKWADLSEDDYGVSLLNDCKYGYDIKDGVMRLTLLRSPAFPNEEADRGIHEFTYCLYPHAGSWKKAATIQTGYSLNCPMYTKVEEAHAGALPQEFSLFGLDCGNVVAETVKKVEDSDDIIIRVHECYNRRTNAVLTFFAELSEVWECDLMKNNLSKIEAAENRARFTIKPYEIKTFRVRLRT